MSDIKKCIFCPICGGKTRLQPLETRYIEFRELKISMNFGNFLYMNWKFEFMIPELNITQCASGCVRLLSGRQYTEVYLKF